jgi:aryl-alcohol dehydrogenase-like predicted oxidoreductase
MYSILTRRPEASVFPVAQRHNLGVLTFSPLNGGWLSGRTDQSSSHRATTRPSSYDPASATGQAKTAAVAKLAALAAEAGMTLPQLAVAFVRAHPAVTSVLIGPRTQAHLDSLLPAAELELTGDILDRIDEIVAPGTELDPADNYAATPPAIEHAHLRRRS